MAESEFHRELIGLLEQWCRQCDFLGSDVTIYSDMAITPAGELPPRIESFRPDIYARNIKLGREVVGEAKSPKDLETKHTKAQLQTFIKKAAENKDSAIVLITRWDHVRYANNLIKIMCIDLKVDALNYAILDQFGGVRMASNGWL